MKTAEKIIGHQTAEAGLAHSDAGFVQAYPEAFCAGHVAAFDFFGGVPQSMLYDNTRIAVARILRGGRRRTRAFGELQSHYLDESAPLCPPSRQ